jgi:prenylcysteine alpha-carboxyl methylesterase
VRGVHYGPYPRNTVDVYLPRAAVAGAGGSSTAAAVVATAAAAVAAGRAASPPLPPPTTPLPVIIYITGGAWTVGHSAWGALLARRLSSGGRTPKKGGGGGNTGATATGTGTGTGTGTTSTPAPPVADPCIVICVDYRNWPAASAAQAAADVSAAIGWALAAAPWLGGDPGRVHLVGQSCGAQLGGLALVGGAGRAGGGAGSSCGAAAVAALLEGGARGGGLSPTPPLPAPAHASWQPSAIASFVGVSGVYDLEALAEHLEARGIGEGGGGRRWLEAVAAGPPVP